VAEPITVARPYAEAVFALASETNSLPVWAEMLRNTSAVAADPRVRAALDNPKLSTGRQGRLFLSLSAYSSSTPAAEPFACRPPLIASGS
jgi:F-type H+-transporting ATPase subunit delta